MSVSVKHDSPQEQRIHELEQMIREIVFFHDNNPPTVSGYRKWIELKKRARRMVKR